ncbi:nuclear transport factor 2 family protein [Aurantiacibacter hainanensis]|uniref:nuclear transport factor 2 family protein n=1 Tax=Aurantiacibacter hainanensis TaxID=3076114 RepID=UPI0030C72229
MFDFDAYIACFLTGDDKELVERFYAQDCAMHSASGVRRGHAGMLEFLAWAHDGVRECPRVQHYLQDENTVFADIDMDFHATGHRPDFPFGEMHPGDSLTVKFLARYDLDADQRIRRLTTSAWPPGVGVTKLPPLGGHPSQVAAYHAYAAAFSNADAERFSRFYTPDVVLELSSVGTIEGADGIAAFYSGMFESVRETLTIHDLDANDERLVVDCTSRFTAIEDAPDFVVAPLARGDFAEVGVKVTYRLRDGLIEHIGVERTRPPQVTRVNGG